MEVVFWARSNTGTEEDDDEAAASAEDPAAEDDETAEAGTGAET